MTIYRACEIILLPGNLASAIFLPSKRNQRKIERNTMKQIFSSILTYMFDANENPEYANAAHIKIVKDTDSRYPNNLIIVALDEMKNIEAMFSFEAEKALEPFELDYLDNDVIDDLIEEIPTDIHYEPNHPKLEQNSEIQDLTSIEFFVANVKSYHASVFGVYCSNCFESESTIAVTTNNYTMFEFCKPCYDKLKRAMIARDAKS